MCTRISNNQLQLNVYTYDDFSPFFPREITFKLYKNSDFMKTPGYTSNRKWTKQNQRDDFDGNIGVR